MDGPLDEILKDAGVIDYSIADPTKEVKVTNSPVLSVELGF